MWDKGSEKMNCFFYLNKKNYPPLCKEGNLCFSDKICELFLE